MTVITENSIAEPTAVALGIFDGVHAGHKLIIRKAVKCSERTCSGSIYLRCGFNIPKNTGKNTNIFSVKIISIKYLKIWA